MKEWICDEVPAVKLNGEVISTMLYQEQELVRCRDCVKRNFDDCPVFGWKGETEDDWFCADGERRDGNA